MSITHLYLLVVFVCAFIGVLRWHHLSTPIKLICILVIYIFFSDTLSFYFNFQKLFSHFPYHFYAMVRFSIFGWVYYNFVKTKNFQIAIKIIGFTLVSWFIISPFLIDMSEISAYNFRIECFWVILLTLGYFYYLSKQDEYVPLKDLSAYWISIGLFIFYTGSTLLFSTIGYMYDLNKELAIKMLNWLTYGPNMFLYVMFSIAFYAKQ